MALHRIYAEYYDRIKSSSRGLAAFSQINVEGESVSPDTLKRACQGDGISKAKFPIACDLLADSLRLQQTYEKFSPDQVPEDLKDRLAGTWWKAAQPESVTINPVVQSPRAPSQTGLWIGGAVAAMIGIVLLGLRTGRTPQEQRSTPPQDDTPPRAALALTVQDVELSVSVLPADGQSSIPLEVAELPLTAGDSLQFQVTSNRPAHFYLLWLDAEGAVSPIWPWAEMRWEGDVARQDVPRTALTFPPGDEHFTLSTDRAGLHTVLLVATEAPLDNPGQLRSLLRTGQQDEGALTPLLLESAVRIENGQVRTWNERFPLSIDQTRLDESPVGAVKRAIEKARAERELEVEFLSFPFGVRS